MDTALLTARLVLAIVFGVAALAKLSDRPGTQHTLGTFAVPPAFAAPLSLLLPLAELGVAVALLVARTTWGGGLGALGLLLLFSAGIGFNLARGRTPDCRCFGQLHSTPVGWRTLARNAGLAAVAAFIVWQGRVDPGPSLVGWIDHLTTIERLALALGGLTLGLLIAIAWLLLQMLAQQGRLLLRMDAIEAQLTGQTLPATSRHRTAAPSGLAFGLPVGSQAPPFSLADLDGRTWTLDDLRTGGQPLLLLFADPGCGPCTALLPEVGRWRRDHEATLTLALISRGTPEANRAQLAEHGIAPVLLQRDYEVAGAYHALMTPSAVLVRPDGTIGSTVASGAEAIRALMAPATGYGFVPLPMAPPAPGQANGPGHHRHRAAVRPAGLKVGDMAPAIQLSDVYGRALEWADFRGSPVVVLFWNPGCGFCRQMLSLLKAWEANRPEPTPRLLVVSTGSAEENRAMALKSPVVLDQSFGTGRLFGANGTPMAVLIDANGRLASDVAAGADAVLALLKSGDRVNPGGP
jgi:peroxiredoxin